MFGGPIGAGVGLLGSVLGGLFGSQPKLPPELQQLYNLQKSMAGQLNQYSQSVPLSQPQEQAALASQRGLLGQEQRQQTGQLASQYGLVNQGTNGVGDFLTNLYNQNQGQQSALTANAMQNALLQRRAALSQASGIGQAAANAVQYQQQTPLGPGFGQLARLIGYNQHMQQNQPQQANGQNAQGGGGGPQPGVIDRTNMPGAGSPSPTPGMDFPSPTGTGLGAAGSWGGTPQDWSSLGAAGALGNPAIQQVTPSTSALNTALNR